MKKAIGPSPLYTFLNYCNKSSLEKEVLDCGAGGVNPPLSVFYEYGYKTYGIDISDKQLDLAHKYCEENRMDLNIIKGDMRKIPFENETISFIYSINSIFHLSKSDSGIAIYEMERVLRKDGICFVNFLSVNDCGYGDGQELSKGEFLQDEGDEKVLHSYYEDNEPDMYFKNFELLRKEKKVIDLFMNENKYILSYIDYIIKKK